MNKRLQMLESMTAQPGADAFAWYGLAMEYRRLDRLQDALKAFDSLRAAHADYLPQYLMAGQLLIELGDAEQAATWLRQGIELAQSVGNSQALGELEDALSGIE